MSLPSRAVVFLFLLCGFVPLPAIAFPDFAACKIVFAKAAGEVIERGEGLRPISDLPPKIRQVFAHAINNSFSERNRQKQPTFLRDFLRKAPVEDKKRFEEMADAIDEAPGQVGWQLSLLAMGKEVELNRLGEEALPEFEKLKAEYDYFTNKYGKLLIEQTIKFHSPGKPMETWARQHFHEWGVWAIEFEDGTTKSFTFSLREFNRVKFMDPAEALRKADVGGRKIRRIYNAHVHPPLGDNAHRPSSMDKAAKASELEKWPGLLGTEFAPEMVEYLILLPAGEDVLDHFVRY